MIRIVFLSLIVLSSVSKVVSVTESEATLLPLADKNYNPLKYAPMIFSQDSSNIPLPNEPETTPPERLSPLQYASMSFLSSFLISGIGVTISAIFRNTTTLSLFGGVLLYSSVRGIMDVIYYRDNISPSFTSKPIIPNPL